MRGRRRQGLPRVAGRRRRDGARPLLRDVGLREGCPAVGLGGAEVVGRREVELAGLLRRERCRGRREARGATSRARCRASRLLEVRQPARLGAVRGTVRLLVAGEAELVGPEIESHGEGGLLQGSWYVWE